MGLTGLAMASTAASMGLTGLVASTAMGSTMGGIMTVSPTALILRANVAVHRSAVAKSLFIIF